jgi:nucleoside-diphosphate-sugar epimerase
MSEEASVRRKASVTTFSGLANRVAVVTGGSGGIGAATSRLLVANGTKVVVNGREEVTIDAEVTGIQNQGGQAIGFASDASSWITGVTLDVNDGIVP